MYIRTLAMDQFRHVRQNLLIPSQREPLDIAYYFVVQFHNEHYRLRPECQSLNPSRIIRLCK